MSKLGKIMSKKLFPLPLSLIFVEEFSPLGSKAVIKNLELMVELYG